MEREESYFDECGNEIKEGDLLKVYHFRHYNRRKKCYMYHIVILKEFKEKLWWGAKMYHVSENVGHYNLRAVANPQTRIIYGTVVIDSKDSMRELKQTPLKSIQH